MPIINQYWLLQVKSSLTLANAKMRLTIHKELTHIIVREGLIESGGVAGGRVFPPTANCADICNKMADESSELG